MYNNGPNNSVCFTVREAMLSYDFIELAYVFSIRFLIELTSLYGGDVFSLWAVSFKLAECMAFTEHS